VDVSDAFLNMGIALGLGLLVGMQRERVQEPVAGIRTFPLITMLGALSAMLAEALGGWIVGAALLGVVAAVVIGNLAILRDDRRKPAPGVTTEIAILVMFAVGAFVAVGPREVAVAVGAGVAVLLHAKAPLHALTRRLGDDDIRAIMQFVLLSLIILPVLPNRTLGPLDVLNPRQIWLMVVLVVGISLGGYIAYKFLGQKRGVALAGILGGLISSTATTVSYARRAATSKDQAAASAVVLMLATAVMYGRVLVEIAIVAPRHFTAIAPPVMVMLLVTLGVTLVAWRGVGRGAGELPPQGNPTELKSALMFGAIYAVVLFLIAVSNEHWPQAGLYAVAGLSGLMDMDAITLSTSRMVDEARLDAPSAWRAILIASAANLVFKTGVVAALGSRALLTRIARLYAACILGAALLLLLWPGG
jgi:uncharacterized membrane protein (DUF4010 family)